MDRVMKFRHLGTYVRISKRWSEPLTMHGMTVSAVCSKIEELEKDNKMLRTSLAASDYNVRLLEQERPLKCKCHKCTQSEIDQLQLRVAEQDEEYDNLLEHHNLLEEEYDVLVEENDKLMDKIIQERNTFSNANNTYYLEMVRYKNLFDGAVRALTDMGVTVIL